MIPSAVISPLPDDVEALKALATAMARRADEAEGQLANSHARESAIEALIAHLKLQNARGAAHHACSDSVTLCHAFEQSMFCYVWHASPHCLRQHLTPAFFSAQSCLPSPTQPLAGRIPRWSCR